MAINVCYSRVKRAKIWLLAGLVMGHIQLNCASRQAVGTSQISAFLDSPQGGFVAGVASVVVGLMVVGAVKVISNKLSSNKTQESTKIKEKTKFSDVAGAAQAKEALQDIVAYLKDPSLYNNLGAKVSKGVLLTGAPGNGKTLLARALAGESGCAFYSVSSPELTNKYYGESAALVRALFELARKNAPSIIFIDEIDVIGADRSKNMDHTWSNDVLNQLLTCMDGFDQFEQPVIVIAATNLPQILDAALTRPGRFDQTVHIPNPDLQARIEILNIYLKKIKIDPGLDVSKIARGTIGFSGAELANLVNEAAVLATRRSATMVEMCDFEEARDRVIMGVQSKTMVVSEQDRKITAYHEAGHALVNLMLPGLLSPLHKITITPRGNSLGAAYYLPEVEQYSTNESELRAAIAMACGGRAAEELIFGQVSTGPSDDFAKATKIARSMVCDYGMSPEIGMAVYRQSYGYLNCAPATAEKIDMAVNNIIQEGYARANEILVAHRDKLDLLANALLEKETLDASEVYELLGMPARQNLSLAAQSNPCRNTYHKINVISLN